MKKYILYILLFLAAAQIQAQGVSFGYDAHGNRISRRPTGIEPASKAQAVQNTAFAACACLKSNKQKGSGYKPEPAR